MSSTLSFPKHSQRHLLGVLGQQIRDMETSSRPRNSVISSGSVALDRLLPGGGYACGSMLELLTESGHPLGATSIALRMAREACGEGKYLVIVDPLAQIYPPALQQLSLSLERVIGLRPKTYADVVWAVDQALRSSAVGCVIVSADRLDDRTARRLQLATEIGGGLGILLRWVSSARTDPSWAEVQWRIAPRAAPCGVALESTADAMSRWFDFTLQRCQSGRTGATLPIGLNAAGEWLEWPIQSGSRSSEGHHVKASHVHLAAELAKPACIRREVAS